MEKVTDVTSQVNTGKPQVLSLKNSNVNQYTINPDLSRQLNVTSTEKL